MKLSFAVVAFTCALQNAVLADPKVVPMKLGRRHPRSVLAKRDPFSATIGNVPEVGLYYVNASVGTPPQVVALQVDTGSSDVWMYGPDACDSQSECDGIVFDPSQSSSSALLVQGGFEITYATPGSQVEGDYISDNFGLGGVTVNNLTMGVASFVQQVPIGVMGISFDTNEAVVFQTGGKPYPSIIDTMLSQGLIKSRSYSLWLDDLDDDSGTILFGGYDTEKYTGDLVLLDIQPDANTGSITSMTVAWTSFAVTDDTGSTLLETADFPLPALLDSGTTLTLLPSNIFAQLTSYFNAVEDETFGWLVSCDIGTANGTLDYGFGNGPIISVAYVELALPAVDEEGNPLEFQDGSAACSFGLDESPDGMTFVMGDTFLRSAYVVFDLDAQQIGIAPTNFGATQSNVVEIPGGTGQGDPVASAQSAATGVTVEQTATGIVAPGGGATATGSGAGTTRHITPSAAASGLGSVTGVKTSLTVAAPGGGTVTVTAGQTQAPTQGQSGAPAATTTSGAAGTRLQPLQTGGLMLVCWTLTAVVMGGVLFAFAP